MDRNQAEALIEELVKNPSLKRHLHAVAAALKWYGRKNAADENKWELAGLLHDADWEAFPTEHPQVIIEKLRAIGEEEIAQAINGHGGKGAIARTSALAHHLFACDELCGFITAYSYMRPTGLTGMEAKHVLKKLKDKGFAANVSREDIIQGAEEIGLSLEQHIDNVLLAMRAVAVELELTK